ncbi:MAG: hypothetical protein ABI596_01995 [Pyrinomonadaceae bacterium]
MSEHITQLIEETPLASLSDSDLTAIRTHVRDCADCARTFAAAQIATLLLKEGVTEVFEPSPFFHTRVLATLRERQSANEGWAWSRLWRSASALAYSMVAAVALMAAVSFAIPATSSLQELTSAYAEDSVILDQGEPLDDQVSDGHILATLYSVDEEAAR